MIGKIKHKTYLPWELLPAILALAWPTILEELLQTAVQYIDTAMVGSLGTHATAAVGSTTTVNWLLGSTIHALGIGFLAYIAQAIGAGKKKDVPKAAAQAVMMVLICGSFFTVLCVCLAGVIPIWMQVDPAIRDIASKYFLIVYAPMLPRTAIIIFGTLLRASGDTKTPMRVGLLVNICNVLLNFLLIFPTRTLSVFGFSIRLVGADLGVLGAAIASAASFCVGGIVITVCLYHNHTLSPKNQSLKPDPQVLAPCLRVALPNALQRFGTSLGYVAFASMINALGEVTAAAHTIANTVESAFYIPGYGMQTAAATLAGNAYGAGDRKKVQNLTRMIVCIEVSLMILSGSLLFIFAPNMMGLFAKDIAVITLGAVVLRMVAVSEPFYGVSIVLEGMMLGMGKTMAPFVVNIIGMWGIRIAGAFICTVLLRMGLVSAWACMIAHNLLLFLSFSFMYGKILGKKENFSENYT